MIALNSSRSPSWITRGLLLVAFVSGCAAAGSAESDSADANQPPSDTDDPNPCEDGGPCDEPEPLDPDAGPIDEDAPIADAGSDSSAATDAAASDAKPADSGAGATKPTCENVDQRLRDDFGIVIKPGTLPFGGLPSQNIGCLDRIKVYQMFIKPYSYKRYERLMKPTDSFTMHLYQQSGGPPGGCSAYVPSSQAIQIRNLKECLSYVSGPSDPDFDRIAMFLIHESGHVLRARNYALGTEFQKAGLPGKDPACYDRGFIKTYSLRTTNPNSESFAEAMGLFIVNKKTGSMGTIKDFQKECPRTYEWVRANIFNDMP